METNNLKLCLYPIQINWGDKESNLSSLERIMETMHPETDLLVLPETFDSGFPVKVGKDIIMDSANPPDGDVIKKLRHLAEKHNVAIAGSLIVNDEGSLFNRGFFIEPSGDSYFADKAHLFRMGDEDKVFTPGSKRLNVRYRGLNISMVICYDVRFPVWCRNKNNEYDLLIVVANWPKVRDNVWDALLTARALENLAYVCGVNCEGYDSAGNEYSGLSKVVDFKGKDITVSPPLGPLKYAFLQKEPLIKFRKKFPAWLDADKFEFI
ncbi:MAG: nitrilase family protein [Muribaculaceae bacterium]|nr:nitrilase family protein [Muribaculaceae bacterium]